MSPCPIQYTGDDGRAARGFTLVEILIVVVILGILAAIVTPRYTQASLESQAAAAATICHAVQQKIIEHRSIYGEYPETIDPNWFVSKALPKSPFEPEVEDAIEYVTLAQQVKHPVIKIINDSAKPFWYNITNGTFRARVARSTPTTKIVVTYNKANGTTLPATTKGLMQTVD